MQKKALRMSKELERFLAQVEKDIQEGRNFSPAFSSGKEMDEYFRSLEKQKV